MTHLLVVGLVVLGAASAAAQSTPVIAIFGTGSVAFDMDSATVAEAQGLVYRAYVDARPAVVLTVTCAGTARPFTCTFPLSQLALVQGTTSTLALAAVYTAADGTQEARTDAPFALRRLAPPAAPVATSIGIRPAP